MSAAPEELLQCLDLVPPYSRFGKLSFCIVPGEWICISGPSGIGKSSLLYTLAGLNTPISGRIISTLANIKTHDSSLLSHCGRRAVHLVPQNLPLLPQLNILDNVLFAQGIAKATVAPDACRNLLIKAGLQDRLTFFPPQLSIGEKQRVCVARGLATNAPVLLIDEPTSNLDSDCVSLLVNLFREATGAGRTLLIVSNDSRLTGFADRALSLDYAECCEDVVRV